MFVFNMKKGISKLKNLAITQPQVYINNIIYNYTLISYRAELQVLQVAAQRSEQTYRALAIYFLLLQNLRRRRQQCDALISGYATKPG